MSRDEADEKRHMPSYDYLPEEELQQLLDVLEQQ
jgi:hypothetical protein